MHNDEYRVRELAIKVFQDESIADDWLRTYNNALSAKPNKLLKTKNGVERVKSLLTRIEHGVYS